MGARFLVVAVVWMVYQFPGLCGCITDYSIPEVSRNVVTPFPRVELVNKNAEKDAFCLNIFLGQLKMKTLWCLEMWGTKYPETQHHTPEQWIPNNEGMRKNHTITMPRYATRLFRLYAVACEVSFYVFTELHHRVLNSSARIFPYAC
jgi:hypothetical protein